MNSLFASIGAALAAVLGALGWAALSFYANIELGWLAWGIGALVGIATRFGAKQESGIHLGIIAALFSVFAIGLGKYSAAYLHVDKVMAESLGGINPEANAEDVKSNYAGEVVEARMGAGQKINWAPGMSVDTAMDLKDFPADVQAEANTKWNKLSDEEKQKEITVLTEGRKEAMKAIGGLQNRQTIILGLLKEGLHPLDLLFFGLAIFTAFRLGAGSED